MKRMLKTCLTALLGARLLLPACHGQESIDVNPLAQNLSFESHSEEGDAFGKITNNTSLESIGEYELELRGGKEKNSFTFNFLSKEMPAGAVKMQKVGACYSTGLEIKNETKAKLGYLSLEGSKNFPSLKQVLFGLENKTNFPLKKDRLSAEAAASLIYSSLWDNISLDNGKININLKGNMPITKKIDCNFCFGKGYSTYNPDKYFFYDFEDEISAKSSLDIKLDKFSVNPFVEAIRINGGERNQEKNAVGLMAEYKNIHFGANYADYPSEDLVQKTVSGGKKFKSFSVSAYYSENKSKYSWLDKSMVGVLLNFEIPSKSLEKDPLKKTKEIVLEHAYTDKNLSFEDATKRLDSLRKISEWIGNNIKYDGTWAFTGQTPEGVYNNRAGVCSEQARLFSYLAKQNNQDVYRFSYSDYPYIVGESQINHEVPMFIDKNGDVLIWDYGRFYKAKVDKNANLGEKALEALNQAGPYIASPFGPGSNPGTNPKNGKYVSIELFSPAEKDDHGEWNGNRIFYSYEHPETDWKINLRDLKHAPIESGVETFIGKDKF